jgi:hypothetical protein
MTSQAESLGNNPPLPVPWESRFVSAGNRSNSASTQNFFTNALDEIAQFEFNLGPAARIAGLPALQRPKAPDA